VDLKRAVLLKPVKTSRSFDSGGSLRLSSLAVVEAVAWFDEGSSMYRGERKEGRESERAAVRKSGCWICGVTEEGNVLFGKTDAPYASIDRSSVNMLLSWSVVPTFTKCVNYFQS
jgi:hypothetical protein